MYINRFPRLIRLSVCIWLYSWNWKSLVAYAVHTQRMQLYCISLRHVIYFHFIVSFRSLSLIACQTPVSLIGKLALKPSDISNNVFVIKKRSNSKYFQYFYALNAFNIPFWMQLLKEFGETRRCITWFGVLWPKNVVNCEF